MGLSKKHFEMIRILLALMLMCSVAMPVIAEEDGVAIAIVYDTSGSMRQTVMDGTGKAAPKYQIANRALIAIANRIQAFSASGNTGSPRKIQAGLFVFKNGEPSAAVSFGVFQVAALTKWANGFSAPDGGTPLGESLSAAGKAVLGSGLTRKHVLIITDGMNTIGPGPDSTLAKLQREAARNQLHVDVHFVAFDVDDKVFEGVKQLGATVVGASNESQLHAQLGYILEKKILLEDEELPKQK